MTDWGDLCPEVTVLEFLHHGAWTTSCEMLWINPQNCQLG